MPPDSDLSSALGSNITSLRNMAARLHAASRLHLEVSAWVIAGSLLILQARPADIPTVTPNPLASTLWSLLGAFQPCLDLEPPTLGELCNRASVEPGHLYREQRTPGETA